MPFQSRWKQNSTVTPHVNHGRRREDEMLSRLLKTRMASTRIQTTDQNNVKAKSQNAH